MASTILSVARFLPKMEVRVSSSRSSSLRIAASVLAASAAGASFESATCFSAALCTGAPGRLFTIPCMRCLIVERSFSMFVGLLHRIVHG